MTGPHPDVATARLAVRRSLADLAPGALVLVACSGGPDSVALAAATAFVAPRMGLRAGAVCIDHGLQPGSGLVAETAVATCRSLGLEPAWSEPVEVTGPGGIEAAARDARYAALAGAAERLGASAVLIGHTLDDQAETVLLALARGSGARSLAGMARVRGIYRRPLLDLRRAQTESVCSALELGTWADPMNASLAHRRVAVRRGVIPALVHALGPGAVPALARTAELLRADADLLDALAAELLAASTVVPERTAADPARSTADHAPSAVAHAPITADQAQTAADPAPTAPRLELDIETLAAAAPALLGRALRAAATAVGAPPGDVGAVHVDALVALVARWHGQGPLDLPGGVEASRRCGRLMLRATTPS